MLPVSVKVGSEEPPSLALEWSAKISRTELERWRDSVAHCDQVAVWLLKGSKGDVLGEDEGRPALGDDSSHFGPQVPRVGGAASLAGGAPGLAWLKGSPRR